MSYKTNVPQSMAQPYVTPMMNARSLSSRSAHAYNCSSSLHCCFIVSLNNDEKLQRSSTGCEQVLERGGTKSEMKVVVCSNQQKYVLLSTRPTIKPDLDTFKKNAVYWNVGFKYNIYFLVKTHFLLLLCFYTQLHCNTLQLSGSETRTVPHYKHLLNMFEWEELSQD